MRKLLAVIAAVMLALVPVVASAFEIAGYQQSQQQQTFAGQAQGHFGSGVQHQNQHGGNVQGQASYNTAREGCGCRDSATAAGVNVQGQGYSQTNTQASFGRGPQFQVQGSGQRQSQQQSSGALSVSR